MNVRVVYCEAREESVRPPYNIHKYEFVMPQKKTAKKEENERHQSPYDTDAPHVLVCLHCKAASSLRYALSFAHPVPLSYIPPG
jgi:hypothetical protein